MRLTGVPLRLRSRIAGACFVVTGSSRGIGRELVRLLLELDAVVVMNGRNAARLESTVTELRGSFPNADLSSVAADVSCTDGARLLASHIADRWDGVDYLINNAGASMRGSFADLKEKTLIAMLDGNVKTAILATTECLPSLRTAGGHVVYVSTVGALHGFPQISLYSAAKAALQRVAEAINAELRSDNVTAGIVYLGFVENDSDKEIFTASGDLLRHTRSAMQSQREAAVALATAAVRRRRRVITVGVGRLLDIAHRCVPNVVTGVLARSKGSIHAVKRDTDQPNSD